MQKLVYLEWALRAAQRSGKTLLQPRQPRHAGCWSRRRTHLHTAALFCQEHGSFGCMGAEPLPKPSDVARSALMDFRAVALAPLTPGSLGRDDFSLSAFLVLCLCGSSPTYIMLPVNIGMIASKKIQDCSLAPRSRNPKRFSRFVACTALRSRPCKRPENQRHCRQTVSTAQVDWTITVA